jgi:hypothetical protein
MEEKTAPMTSVAVHVEPVAPAADKQPAPPLHAGGYPDLLLDSSFLLPFISLSCLMLGAFGVVRGMCFEGVPGNCNLVGSTQILQQLLASIERIFLVVAIGDMSFLFPAGWRSKSTTIAYAVLMHVIALAATVIVSAGLKDYSIRHGMGPLRIGVAVILIVILLPPLIYSIVWQYTSQRRWKALAIFGLYITFLIANAGLKELHVHHWTWGYMYLLLLYPAVTVQETQRDSCFHRFMVVWCHVASMIALGVLIQGLAAYGGLFFFISTPFSQP